MLEHTHSQGCMCLAMADNGADIARKWIAAGLVPTADHRGWADAASHISAIMAEAASQLEKLNFAPSGPAAKVLSAMSVQFGNAGLTLHDLAPDMQ